MQKRGGESTRVDNPSDRSRRWGEETGVVRKKTKLGKDGRNRARSNRGRYWKVMSFRIIVIRGSRRGNKQNKT